MKASACEVCGSEVSGPTCPGCRLPRPLGGALAKAFDLFNHGRYAEAMKKLEQGPEDLASLRLGAHAAFHAADLPVAHQKADRALGLARRGDPVAVELTYARGLARLALHQLEGAEADFLEASKGKPPFVRGRFYLGLLFPDDRAFHAAALMHRGIALRGLGRLAQAIASFESALESGGENPDLTVNLAEALAAQGRTGDALGRYRALLKQVKDPLGRNRILNDIGVTLYHMGRVDEALKSFVEVLREDPGNRDALANLGEIYGRTGRAAEAAQELAGILTGPASAGLLMALSRALGGVMAEGSDAEQGPLGASPAFSGVRDVIRRAAVTDATVLIEGENGTGKELAAREIVRLSPRAGRPFVVVNCAAIPENLLESELFGHEKGAFTGAAARRIGRFEAAEGGTLFLDEVAEMSPGLQAKVLRAIQNREFERVGGTETLHADVRILAATNRDLREEIRKGRFREDLFFRLNVIGIRMPPLRERREDIALLARHFLDFYRRKYGRRFRDLEPAALAALVAHDWPGNVRELRNVLERAAAIFDGEWVTLDQLPLEVRGLPLSGPAGNGASPLPPGLSLAQVEADYIRRTLLNLGGNKSKAAAQLGISRSTLHEKLKEAASASDTMTQ